MIQENSISQKAAGSVCVCVGGGEGLPYQLLNNHLPSFSSATKGSLLLGLSDNKGSFPNYYMLYFRFSRKEN